MTPEKSLEVISEAIAKCRKDFEKNSGTPMIIWGIIVLIFSIAVWLTVKTTQNPLWNFLWFAVPVVGYPLTYLATRKSDIKGAKNFINETLGHIWIVFGIFATTIALVLSFIAPQYMGAIIIALMGYATTVTGTTLKNGYIIAGGIITGIGGVIGLCALNTFDATLIFAVAAILSLIIPGIMMNRKACKN